MTTKGLRYERFECDVCHRKQKLELEEKDGNYFTDIGNYSFTVRLSDLSSCIPTKKPDTVKLEMCEECDLSFKSWKIKRQSEVD